MAKTELAKPRTVKVFAEDGTLGDLDVSEEGTLDLALRSGYRLATQEEADAYRLERRYGDQDVRTAAEGFLRGTTFGLSDYAMGALDDELKADIQARAVVNPISASLGEVAGTVLPAIATGGSGMLAKAATLTPAGAAARLGMLGSRAVSGGEATTALARVAQAARAAAVSGAIEGGLYGAAKQADQDWLNDHEVSAQRMLVGGLLGTATGAVGGALTGGALGALAEVPPATAKFLGRVMRGDAQARAAAAATAESAATSQGTARIKLSIDEALDSGIDPEDALLRIGGANSIDDIADAGSLKGFAQASGRHRELISDGSEQLENEFNTIVRSEQVINDVFGGKGGKQRLNEAVEWLDEAGRGAPVSVVSELADDGAKRFRLTGEPADLLASARAKAKAITGHLKKGFGEDIAEMISRTESEVVEHLANGRVGKAYNALDDLKGALGALSKTKPARNAGAREAIEEIADDFRTHLERVDIYGAMAERQTTLNKALHPLINTSESAFNRKLVLSTSDDLESSGWRRGLVVNADRVKGVMSRVGHDSTVRQEFLEMKKFMRARVMNAKVQARMSGDDELIARANDAESALVRAEAWMDSIAESGKAMEKYTKTWGAFAEQLPPGYVKSFLQGAGTVLGKGVDASKKMLNLEVELSNVSQAGAKALSKTEANAQAAYDAALSGERVVSDSAEGFASRVLRSAARVSRVARDEAVRGVSILGASLSVKDPDSYEKAIERIQAMRDPDSDERNEMRGKLATIALESPELADAIEDNVQRRADLLAAKAGTSHRLVSGRDMFERFDKPKHSPQKAAALARYARAIDDPKAAFDRLKSGEVVAEDVEAIRDVAPQLYQRWVAQVLSEVSRAKGAPSREARRALREVMPKSQEELRLVAELQQLAASGIGAAAAAQEDAQAQESAQVVTPGNAKVPDLAGSLQTRNQQIGGM